MGEQTEQAAGTTLQTAPIRRARGSVERAVRAYDFRRPRHLSADQMRTVHRLHIGACETLQARLGRYLGVSLEIRLESADEITGALIPEILHPQSFINVLDLAPLTERGLLAVDSPLCLAFVDRVLGGPCQVAASARTLTAVDQAASEGPMEMLLRGLRDAWKESWPLKMAVLERRADIAQVKLPGPTEVLLAVTLLITGQLGENRVRLFVPLAGLKSMADGAQRAVNLRPDAKQAAAHRETISRSMEKVLVPMLATVGGADLPVGSLMRLQVGDIIRLDQDSERPVVLHVGGRPAFIGKMGLRGRHKAVQVMNRINPNEEA